MKIIPSLLLAAFAVSASAEPKLTLIDGSWNPGEGGPVTTKLNPLHRPFGVDFDSKGRMWIVELQGRRVRRVANSVRSHVAGGCSKSYKGDGGPLGQATFNGPKHVCADPSGNVFIADDVSHLIRKYYPKTGAVTTVLGRGKIKLKQPHGVTWEKGKL